MPSVFALGVMSVSMDEAVFWGFWTIDGSNLFFPYCFLRILLGKRLYNSFWMHAGYFTSDAPPTAQDQYLSSR